MAPPPALASTYYDTLKTFTEILKRYQRGSVDRLGVEAALAATSQDIIRDNPGIPDVDTFITMTLSEAAATQLNQGIQDIGFTASSFPQWERGITEHLDTQFADPDSTASLCGKLRTEWVIIRLNVRDVVADHWASPNRHEYALEPFPLVKNGPADLGSTYAYLYEQYANAFSYAARAASEGIVGYPVKVHVTPETDIDDTEHVYHRNPEMVDGHRFTPDVLATYLWEKTHAHISPPRL